MLRGKGLHLSLADVMFVDPALYIVLTLNVHVFGVVAECKEGCINLRYMGHCITKEQRNSTIADSNLDLGTE